MSNTNKINIGNTTKYKLVKGNFIMFFGIFLVASVVHSITKSLVGTDVTMALDIVFFGCGYYAMALITRHKTLTFVSYLLMLVSQLAYFNSLTALDVVLTFMTLALWLWIAIKDADIDIYNAKNYGSRMAHFIA
jgi:hypothetical protein